MDRQSRRSGGKKARNSKGNTKVIEERKEVLHHGPRILLQLMEETMVGQISSLNERTLEQGKRE